MVPSRRTLLISAILQCPALRAVEVWHKAPEMVEKAVSWALAQHWDIPDSPETRDAFVTVVATCVYLPTDTLPQRVLKTVAGSVGHEWRQIVRAFRRRHRVAVRSEV